MSVARALADMALRRCLRGEALEREALLELVAVPPASDEALYLRHAAHKAALALDGGRAYLWGALGLDYTPCPMNCAFCSLGEAWKPSRRASERNITALTLAASSRREK